MQAIFYGADEHYRSGALGVPSYENAKQIVAAQRRLVNLYVFNKSADPVYLLVWDTVNAGTDQGPASVFPIAGGSFISIVANEKYHNGIYVKGFTDAACTVAAGSVLHYKCDYTAYV